jgi:DNA 3'-phosphatase
MNFRQQNERLAVIFDDMARDPSKNTYQKRAYKSAADAIRRYDKPITSGAQAKKEIRGIGKSISEKIDEVLATGKLQFLEERPEEVKEKERVIKQFEKIHGVGPKIAEKWYNEGYRSLEDLSKIYSKMTDAQKLGYVYYNQLNQKIPRSEIDQYKIVLSDLWSPLGFEFEIGGSYRRGEPDSGDIDVVGKSKIGVDLNSLLQPLSQKQMVLGNLAIGPNKYNGIIRLREGFNARRFDIQLVDDFSWPYALLYFTGSKQLNIEMRAKAGSMGYTLNEYGMFDTSGVSRPAKTERDIFNFLGMKYLEPNERAVMLKPGITLVTEPVVTEPVVTEPVVTNPVAPPVQPTIQLVKIGGKWHRPSSSLFLYVSDGIVSTGNLACFDLDWTLVRTYEAAWPKTPSDIKLLPNRTSTLKLLREKGYTIVIFTNQKSTTENKVQFNYERVNNFINLIPDIPIILLMSTSEDIYRKPNVGMYQILLQMIPPITSAFYCGDAAGRPQDFSDSDIKFAKSAGMKFYTPEQLFLPVQRLKPLPEVAMTDIELSMGKNMVLFVGMPGSGKTTYYQQKLAPLGYVHVNQDILKTKNKVLKLTRETVGKGLNICIDATNPGQDKRQEFYNLGALYGYNILVIYFIRDGKGWNKLRPNPVPTIAYSTYYKYLVEPTSENTPGSLYQLMQS